jgi:hypothetical protein
MTGDAPRHPILRFDRGLTSVPVSCLAGPYDLVHLHAIKELLDDSYYMVV